MNAEPKRKLVNALRSGKFIQGISALRPEENKYCCLGVACKVYQEEHPEAEWEYVQNQYTKAYTYKFLGEAAVLPQQVIDWFGFNFSNPYWGNGCQYSLASENDSGLTFEQIADIIEKEPWNEY